ncbi:EamA-like transporter family protein [Rhodobacter viridis]|uniref:EamA-like transporter family protein n=1 Tax=Rhodobacter viridis TaxID=1054202 RepID=A0A318U8C7_9RHOB|nr:DMT family transporter [Rhodobacter viridis]PYF11125.1 EamA-like transporter family protein [Rhodobacter viridis]
MTDKNHTALAAAAISGYALIIGFTDNYVRVIASEIGLWQFHLTRSLMVAVLLLVAVPLFRLDLRPRNFRAVAARSAVHGVAMLCYFGSLGFLPVPQVAAGLFTAPIFVLLITRFVYGESIGLVRIAAVAMGFGGILLVLGPEAARIGPAAVIPVLGGALYALGNIATQRWCPGEGAVTLTAGFFTMLGILGACGLGLLTLFPMAGEGPLAFILRGPAMPSNTVLFWVFAQALGSLVAVGLMVKGYQLADATRASVFEYTVLPAAALWGFLLWAEVPGLREWAGMGLIWLAGLAIVARGR